MQLSWQHPHRLHPEADVDGSERGCVVDAVADHRHGFAGGFEFRTSAALLRRTHVAEGACAIPSCFGDVFDLALFVARS